MSGERLTDAATGAVYEKEDTTWRQIGICCPNCKMTSYNPNDIDEGYCGNCHDWTTPRGETTWLATATSPRSSRPTTRP